MSLKEPARLARYLNESIPNQNFCLDSLLALLEILGYEQRIMMSTKSIKIILLHLVYSSFLSFVPIF
jgi:hypothetical protein